MKYIITLFTLMLLASFTFSHNSHGYSLDGDYKVGKTSCTIQWDDADQLYKVYWENGIGYTVLYYKNELPNGNRVYDEFSSDGKTYTGTFTFKNYKYLKGEYERADEKIFTVTKE